MSSTTPAGARLRDLYGLAAIGGSLALVAGLLELAYRTAGYPLSPRLPDVGEAFTWVLPAGMLLLCAPVIGLVLLVRAVRPGWMPAERGAFLVGILPFLSISVFLLLHRMPAAVHLILAAGLASVLARWIAPRYPQASRVFGWAFPVLLAIPLGARALAQYRLTTGERAVIAALPEAPAGARNVLFLVWDTVREANLGLYGYARDNTPHLAALAARGVTFDRAYSTSPWTLPSHASMFTGRDMQDLNANWTTPLDGSHPVLAEVLAGIGYRTAGFTANRMAAQYSSGLSRGFHRYEDWRLSRYARDLVSHLTVSGELLSRLPVLRGFPVFREGYKEATDVTDDFLRWLDRDDPSTPFFAFLNYFNAHQAYRAPTPYRERFPGEAPQDKYDAAIAFQDDELDRLLGALAERGMLDRTVVVLTSDHGEAFGDHGTVGHGGTLFVEQLHVPLVVVAPGRAPEGLRVAAPVSLRDAGVTVLDLALDRVPPHGLAGRSLARAWRDSVPSADTLLAGAHEAVKDTAARHISAGNATAVVAGQWHYILTGDGQELLYDMVRDSLELEDLAGRDSLRPVLASMRAYLRARLDTAWTARLP